MTTSATPRTAASLAQPCVASRIAGAMHHAKRVASGLPSTWHPEPLPGIGRAQVAVALLPALRDLRVAEKALADAIDGAPASPAEVSAITNWLSVAVNHPLRGLGEVLMLEVDESGLSAPVLAGAALRIARRSGSPPPPADMIAEAHRVRREADDALRRVVGAIRMRTRAEAILAAARRPPRHRVLPDPPGPVRR